VREFVDAGVSGSREKRPALDDLIKDAKRRRFDVLVCWRLDRLGRSIKHLVVLTEELTALGIAFVSLGEGIECTTPAGKLQLPLLAALAEFERKRIREHVLQDERARGHKESGLDDRGGTGAVVIPGGTVRAAAKLWGVSKSTAARRISEGL
jgi:DNA invertase Pin-like site-specific DNA recombinase